MYGRVVAAGRERKGDTVRGSCARRGWGSVGVVNEGSGGFEDRVSVGSDVRSSCIGPGLGM